MAPAQETTAANASSTVKARLLSPLTTGFSRKGDLVCARVIEPAQYQSAILEGEIHEVKAGPAGKTSVVQFDFHTIHLSEKVLPVSTTLVAISNSRHQAGVDEDGNALESGSPGVPGKLVASVFSRSSGSVLKVAVKAGQLSFAPGSEIVVQMQLHKPRGQ